MKRIHGGDVYRNYVKVDFSVNINPLGIPGGVEEALQMAIKHCCEYPDIMIEKLAKALSRELGVRKDYILFGNGASEIFLGVVHAIKPKKILIPIPSFYGYEHVSKAVDSDIVYYQLKQKTDFLMDEDFLEVLTEDMDMLFLANPNNPTGKLLSIDYLKKLLEICKRKQIWVILDECFIEFCGNEYSMLTEIENYNNLLLVRAFTKIYAIPGVRLGYMVSSNTIILEKIRQQLPEWNISTFAQEAGVACMNHSAFIEKTIHYVKIEREFLIDKLRQKLH